MSIRISYRTDDGEELYSEMGLSESYENVLSAVCAAWENDLPHDGVEGYLVREEISDNETKAIRILPCRFAELVREVSPGQHLELRLKLKTRRGSRRSESGLGVPSILELPSAMNSMNSDLNNRADPSIEELRILTSANNLVSSPISSPVQAPLTPESILGIARPALTRPALAPSPVSQNNGPSIITIVTQNAGHNPSRSPTHDNGTNAAYNNGLSAYAAGRYHDARIYFQAAADYCREMGNSRQEAECLTHIGIIYRHEKEFSNARSHFFEAREIYIRLGVDYREQQLQCDRQLAQVDERAGDSPTALRAYENIRTIARNEGFRKQEAWCAYALGHLHNEIRLYDKALGHLKQAIEIAQTLPRLDSKLEIEAHASEESGRSEELRGNRSRAIEHYEWALRQFVAGGRGRWTADENRIKTKLVELQRRRNSILGVPIGFLKKQSNV
ncbi:unnamed protein product [Rhizoctonia solani]|uniref:Tetratricopeptide repeat protein 29 n=1 Tax=Rhizoctonia solani TaxID=456999 RepID=A0A8H3GMQ8_9AGAM|nr:unnamed protein product [Rhizoctonia solani]